MRHIVYHPKLEEIVFPNQPLLKHLASENCLLTVCEGSDLTNMQQNVIREWLEKPVNENHPVFHAANSMSSENEANETRIEMSMESEDSYSDLKTLAEEVSKTKPIRMPRTMYKKPHKRDPRTGLPIIPDRLTTLDEEYGVDNLGLEMDEYKIEPTSEEYNNTVNL